MTNSLFGKHLARLRKSAYVPLTPAAAQAVGPAGAPPMPPPGAPMPPPPGGAPMMPPPQGGGQPPIDPETGFIIVDPANGVEMDPITGLIFIKPTGEFFTQDGQPVPKEQAIAMLQQTAPQGGAMPPPGAPMPPAPQGEPMPADAGMPPMPPQGAAPMPPDMGASMPTPPADPSMGSGMPPVDPTMDPAAQMASGEPMIDPQSGLPLDPATGMFAPSATPGAGIEGGLDAAMPGLEEFVAKYEKNVDQQDKLNKRLLHEISGTQTTIQQFHREIQQLNDNYDTMFARLENILNLLTTRLGGRVSTQVPSKEL